MLGLQGVRPLFLPGIHQVGGCARLLLAGGMLNITATYSRIISATGRFCAKEKGEGGDGGCARARRRGEGERESGGGGRKAPAIRTARCDFKYVHRLCASAVPRNDEPFGFLALPLPPPPPPYPRFLRSLDGKWIGSSWFLEVGNVFQLFFLNERANFLSVDISTPKG